MTTIWNLYFFPTFFNPKNPTLSYNQLIIIGCCSWRETTHFGYLYQFGRIPIGRLDIQHLHFGFRISQTTRILRYQIEGVEEGQETKERQEEERFRKSLASRRWWVFNLSNLSDLSNLSVYSSFISKILSLRRSLVSNTVRNPLPLHLYLRADQEEEAVSSIWMDWIKLFLHPLQPILENPPHLVPLTYWTI